MDIILIAGLWLPRTIWSEVGSELQRLGHNPLPVALPGVDNDPWAATLAAQVSAALDVVDAADRPLVVGHSAACTLAWMIADRRPDKIDSVVLIGGFPSSGGNTYADFFPIVDGVMAFPGVEAVRGPGRCGSRRRDQAHSLVAGRSGTRGRRYWCCRTSRRKTIRRPADAGLSRVHPRASARLDRRWRCPCARQCPQSHICRHRHRPHLAYGHQTGRACPYPRHRRQAVVTEPVCDRSSI